MGKKQYHTRLDDDTAQWVDEFKEERDITQAEAVRRLVRAGQQEYQRDDSDDSDDSDSRERGVVRHGVSENVARFLWSAVGAATGAGVVGVVL